MLVSWAPAVRGQSGLDGFNPHADAPIRAIALQPDGKVLIGGDFTTLAPNSGPVVNRSNLARLNPDGTLDTSFVPTVNGAVRSIVVQLNGHILIGGDFTLVNKVTRNHIARLDGTGVLDSFDPNASDIVRAIVLQPNGQVVFGGDFKAVAPNGGSTVKRPHIARVNPSGSLDSTFGPDVDNLVLAIALQTDGNILVGGVFTSINSTTRNHVARVKSDGSLDTAFNPNANGTVFAVKVTIDGTIFIGGDFSQLTPNGGSATARRAIARLNKDGSLQTGFNATAIGFLVDAISIDAENRVLVGGEFGSMGGQLRNRIARLNPVSGAADSFDPNANSLVTCLAVQQDGKVLMGGLFSTLTPDGSPFAITRTDIARLEIDGRVDQTLDIGSFPGSIILATAVQTDGKILIGGFFNNLLGVTRGNIARLNTDGTLDPLFNPMANNTVLSIAVQADGKILIGGIFTTLTPNFGFMFTRNHIARLNADGTVDTTFNPNANGQVGVLAVQPDGKILVGGNGGGFTTIGGQSRRDLARLDPVTGLADLFNPDPHGGEPTSIVVQPDGKILIGGTFAGQNAIAGQTLHNLARLNADGTIDPNFHPEPNDSVIAVALQTDGRIVVGGDFTHIGGAARNFIARIESSSGIADPTFDPHANNEVDSIAIQSDGKVLASGFFNGFNSIGGAFRNRIARLNGITGAADSFSPDANGQVAAINLLQDGKVLAAGFFTVIGQVSHAGFARLSNDTAALQNLSVTPTTINFTRGGSSPQFARLTFEASPDDQNFTFLGNGTPSGTSWTLSGAVLPTGQNVVVRARGLYHSGFENASESLTGTRQTAFFPGNFVIGDLNAVVGQRVVFWGSQWAKSNSLSGGPAPESFKGFTSSIDTTVPQCGGNWQTGPGPDPAQPDKVPSIINVIVASSVTKPGPGPVISGNISKIAVVQTDPGYQSDPGHAGTGTVIALSCGE